MCARAHVVRDVVHQHAVKTRCIHHDDVIEALTSDRADDALHVGVLPRRSRRRTHFLNMHPVEGSRDVRKDRIAIVQWIPGCLALRKGVSQLLSRPCCCRMRGDRHVDDPSTVVGEYDEHEQQPKKVTVGTTKRSAAMIWLA